MRLYASADDLEAAPIERSLHELRYECAEHGVVSCQWTLMAKTRGFPLTAPAKWCSICVVT